MINWLGKKCPRDFCNGDLFEELDQFLEPTIRCFLCAREWGEDGKFTIVKEAPTLRGLKTIAHGISNDGGG